MKNIGLIILLTLSLLIATGCSESASEPSPTPSPTPSKVTYTTKNIYDSDESVVTLMDKAINADTKEERIEYAEKACIREGIEPKALTDKELSDLESRQVEIDIMVESLRNDFDDKESKQKAIALNEEKMDNVVLIFYNQVLRLDQ